MIDAPAPALRIARAGAVAAVVVLLVAFGSAVVVCAVAGTTRPELFVGSAWSRDALLAVLAAWHVPLGVFIGYWLALEVLLVAASTVAAVLLLRGNVSWLRIYLAVALTLHATAGGALPLIVSTIDPAAGPVLLLWGLAWFSLLPIAYVFPDGRFVPRWTRWMVPVWVLAYVGATAFVPPGIMEDPSLIAIAILLLGSCVFAQVHRYVRVSGRLERQQTKWVLLAVALRFVVSAVTITTPLGALSYEPNPLGLAVYVAIMVISYAVSAAFPLAITVAVLRYRLFDIDVWISRALVYGTLTAFVVGSYALVVGGLGVLWRGTGDTVLPLLAAGLIAVTFSPVRERVQRRVNRMIYGDRDDPDRALSRLGRQLDGVLRPDAVASTVVAAVATALRVPYVVLEEGVPARRTATTGTEVADTESFPVRFHGAPVARLVIGRRVPGAPFSPTDIRLVNDLAAHCGAALSATESAARSAVLADELQQSRERLVTAREEERRRLRRDLHDTLGPALGSSVLTIDAVRAAMAAEPDVADQLLRDLKDQNLEALDEVRRLARRLRPPVLDDLGLVAALEHAVEPYRHGELRVELRVAALPELPAALEVAVYRIGQEALTNVSRHAGARHCTVALELVADVLRFEVADDGVGIGSDARAGVGTASMRERAEELSGSLTIDSAPGAGTRVVARFPMAAPR